MRRDIDGLLAPADGETFGFQAHRHGQDLIGVVVQHRPQHGLVADNHKARRDRPHQHVQVGHDVSLGLAHLGIRGDSLAAHAPGGQVVGEVDAHLGVAASVGAHHRIPEGSVRKVLPHRLGTTTAPSLALAGEFEGPAVG